MRLMLGGLVGMTLIMAPAGAWAIGQIGPAQLGMAPLCGVKVLTLQAPPNAGPVAVTINPVAAAPACIDKDGDALTLTAVDKFTNGATGVLVGNNQVEVSNIGPGGATFTYLVVDSRGLAVRNVFTIRRP